MRRIRRLDVDDVDIETSRFKDAARFAFGYTFGITIPSDVSVIARGNTTETVQKTSDVKDVRLVKQQAKRMAAKQP